MIIENDEEREKTQKAIEEGEDKLIEADAKWKKLLIEQQMLVEERDKEILELKKELDKAKFQHERQVLLNERPKEDPMIAVLKAKIKELEDQLQIVEAGKQAIIEENMQLAVATDDVEKKQEDVHAIYRPQLAQKDKAMNAVPQPCFKQPTCCVDLDVCCYGYLLFSTGSLAPHRRRWPTWSLHLAEGHMACLPREPSADA